MDRCLLSFVLGYLAYIFLIVVGYVREFIWGLGPLGTDKPIVESNREGYAPLYSSFESFYIRNVYRRLKNVFNRPIASVPGATVDLVNRHSDDHFWTWTLEDTLQENMTNLASYNYLGFAENSGTEIRSSIVSSHRSIIVRSLSRTLHRGCHRGHATTGSFTRKQSTRTWQHCSSGGTRANRGRGGGHR